MSATLPNEEHLVRALQNKQGTDFTLIYDAYSPALYGVLLRLVKDTDLAEDLLQDAFIKIWTNSQHYNSKNGRLFTWLITITRHLALDELRSRKVRVTANEYIYERSTESISPSFAGLADHKALLNHLSPKYKTVVELMYIQDYTILEIAKTLKMPEGTVKTRVRKGLQQLKEFFNQDIQYYQAGYTA